MVFYFFGDFGQALLIRSCHEDVIWTRKSHNCAGTAFVQGDSTGGSKLIEQTLHYNLAKLHLFMIILNWVRISDQPQQAQDVNAVLFNMN